MSSTSTALGAFPVKLTFCVYLLMTGGRGSGQAQIVVTDAETDEGVYSDKPHLMRFGSDPLKVVGVKFNIANCGIPKAGLYWVEFRYNGSTLMRQPLWVKVES